MESKNVIAAISLSAAVIILYSLFFAPPPKEINKDQIQKEKFTESSDTPSIEKNYSVGDLITGYGVSEAILHYYNIYGGNIKGKRVSKIFSGYSEAGINSFDWKVESLSSGMYFIRMQANGQIVDKQKAFLVK